MTATLGTIGKVAIAMTVGIASPTLAATASKQTFGSLADGTRVERITLTNANGVSAGVITLGATLQSLIVPDRDGKPGDVVLGHDTAQEYLVKPQFFGVSVGRYANRIARGRFSLDGKEYVLETNDGPNHLHGGFNGFDKRIWTVESLTSGSEARVVLRYVSPDGEGGYPGTLTSTVTYALNEKNELSIEYRATTNKPTIVNLTNHAYFDLSAGTAPGGVMDHKLTLQAERYTPVDATLIPTGERRAVAGTPFDFRQPTAIGARVRDGRDDQIRTGTGYDHNFIVNGTAGTLRPAARLEDPLSGRVMDMLVTAPGLQFYSGNFLDGSVAGRNGRIYRQGDGLCLEPQVFPDAPNKPDFPSARLDPGQTYVNKMVFRFSSSGK
ncbi:aldose 1-epimerase [Sphingobium sp. OAS761]|uniref:aldose epimerase family protein n=1 Tax=Sphingobium sp. OAS761 TaxID=2817901 RepID=UPI00209F4AEB|nr:aldose epimerase family protein [Sphingobium sp. OAS761]MCP1469246.1 aldose 1-epimerase [Sphingobium sp. OAS761]